MKTTVTKYIHLIDKWEIHVGTIIYVDDICVL